MLSHVQGQIWRDLVLPKAFKASCRLPRRAVFTSHGVSFHITSNMTAIMWASEGLGYHADTVASVLVALRL